MVDAAKAPSRPPKRRSTLGCALQTGLAFTGFVFWWAWHRGLMHCDDHPVADRFATLLQGLGTTLRLEIDLAREARFVRRFADAWRGSPDVEIPDVVDGVCTASVMVQRFSSGLRIDAVAATEREACARRLVDSYVTPAIRARPVPR